MAVLVRCRCGSILTFPSPERQGEFRCQDCGRQVSCPPTELPLFLPSASLEERRASAPFLQEEDGIRPDVALVCEHYCPHCSETFAGTSTVCPTCRNRIPDVAHVSYASPVKRLAASLIDLLLLLVAALALFGMWAKMPLSVNMLLQNTGYFSTIVVSIAFCSSICFHAACGQTPGKMLIRIKAVRSDCTRISISRAIARFFVALLAVPTLGLSFALAWLDSKRRALHDRLCHTVVIDLSQL